jgi:hypothetical protein
VLEWILIPNKARKINQLWGGREGVLNYVILETLALNPLLIKEEIKQQILEHPILLEKQERHRPTGKGRKYVHSTISRRVNSLCHDEFLRQYGIKTFETLIGKKQATMTSEAYGLTMKGLACILRDSETIQFNFDQCFQNLSKNLKEIQISTNGLTIYKKANPRAFRTRFVEPILEEIKYLDLYRIPNQILAEHVCTTLLTQLLITLESVTEIKRELGRHFNRFQKKVLGNQAMVNNALQTINRLKEESKQQMELWSIISKAIRKEAS